MFSTRSRSSRQPPGRQSSRRLQLEQESSAVRLPAGASACAMKMVLAGLVLSWATAGMKGSLRFSVQLRGGALRDHLAHALEFARLVEEIPRPEAQRVAAVGLGSKVGQHVEVDARLLPVHFLQHVEAAALVELQVEHHDVGLELQDVADRGARLGGVPGNV